MLYCVWIEILTVQEFIDSVDRYPSLHKHTCIEKWVNEIQILKSIAL